MILNFLKQEALDTLRRDIPNNIEYYVSSDKWLDEYFESKNIPRYTISSGITVPDVELIIGDHSTDIDNSIALYEAFKGKLNAVQATDLRLWAWLAHDTYWEYMSKRWSIDQPDEDDESIETVSRISSRYFFGASKGKAYVRQGIARLYWAAYLSYDPTNKNDPYEYTRYYLAKQDTFSFSTEHALARNKTLLLAALKSLKSAGNVSRKQVRQFYADLNQEGGVILLDALDSSRCEDLTKRILDTVLSNS